MPECSQVLVCLRGPCCMTTFLFRVLTNISFVSGHPFIPSVPRSSANSVSGAHSAPTSQSVDTYETALVTPAFLKPPIHPPAARAPHGSLLTARLSLHHHLPPRRVADRVRLSAPLPPARSRRSAQIGIETVPLPTPLQVSALDGGNLPQITHQTKPLEVIISGHPFIPSVLRSSANSVSGAHSAPTSQSVDTYETALVTPAFLKPPIHPPAARAPHGSLLTARLSLHHHLPPRRVADRVRLSAPLPPARSRRSATARARLYFLSLAARTINRLRSARAPLL
ncbi:uncharacterized protein V3H82_023037 [Fundulus diaphanus]